MPVGRLLSLLLPPALVMYAIFQGLQVVVLPLQIEAVDASHKLSSLALITTICSLTAVVGLVAGGAASDATRSRWGRRAPWLIGMSLASAALVIALGALSSLLAIVLGAAILWFTLNFFQAALLAVVPDRVAPVNRALASWAFGFGGPAGAFVGVNISAAATPLAACSILATLLLICIFVFVLFAPEGSSLDLDIEDRTSLGPLAALARLAASFRDRDFAFAFGARALLFLAQYVVTGYLLYAMQDYVGASRLPGASVEVAAGLFNTVRTLASVSFLLITGWLLQKTERRRVFVVAYSFLMATAMALPAVSATWAAMVGYAALGGAAWGVFASVDLAIVSHVLPNRKTAGRDIGILAVAGALPQLLAPALGAVAIGDFGYRYLFALGAALTLAAGFAASRLRSVR